MKLGSGWGQLFEKCLHLFFEPKRTKPGSIFPLNDKINFKLVHFLELGRCVSACANVL